MKKIRLLFLHGTLACGGAEQALYDLLTLLDPEKFEITLLVFYDGGKWVSKFQEAGIRMLTPWTCQRSTDNPFVKLWNKYLGLRILRSFRKDGRNLVPLCVGEEFDLIVSYNVWDLQQAGFVPGTKALRFIHGDMGTNPEFAETILNSMDVMEKFDRFICVSQGAAESFRRMTGLGDRVTVHYNPIDSDRIRAMAREQAALPEDLPLICAVGRLSREKGFLRLIRIHSHLVKEGLAHRLVIVGEGSEREALEKEIAAEGVRDTVILAGYQENPYPYIQRSRLLVCASYTEALPVVAMEALVLGKPVVSAVPSVGEIFAEETCGMLTGNDDDSLEQGLRQVLSDGECYARLRAGAERRSRCFEGKHMVREIEEEFLDLVK